MPVLTTTAPEVDEELQNRCIVLTVDEDREQTRAIHELQRAAQTIEGLLATRESGSHPAPPSERAAPSPADPAWPTLTPDSSRSSTGGRARGAIT